MIHVHDPFIKSEEGKESPVLCQPVTVRMKDRFWQNVISIWSETALHACIIPFSRVKRYVRQTVYKVYF